jgi:hypothetical protein
MFGSKILDVAIGVIFVYILVSIICSAVREGIEAWLKTRAAYLEYGIRELLRDGKNGTGLVTAFYNHPLIFSLFGGDYTPADMAGPRPLLARGRNLPSYIPAANFATALMDIAARGPDTNASSSSPNSVPISLSAVRANVTKLASRPVQRAVLAAIDIAQGDLDKAQANIEAWYNGAMDRVSGWYKRSTQWILFTIGFLVAAVLNINTITIADYLFKNDAARAAIVAQAGAAANNNSLPKDSYTKDSYEQAMKELNSISLPIGWSASDAPKAETTLSPRLAFKDLYSNLPWSPLPSLAGWLMTALAASLGAPFWFDLLGKLMVVRSTLKPGDKGSGQASEQPAPAAQSTVSGSGPASVTTPGSSSQPSDENIPPPSDLESSLDGCEVTVDTPTNDADLPAAEGGVA